MAFSAGGENCGNACNRRGGSILSPSYIQWLMIWCERLQGIRSCRFDWNDSNNCQLSQSWRKILYFVFFFGCHMVEVAVMTVNSLTPGDLCMQQWAGSSLTHWGWDKMATILQMKFSRTSLNSGASTDFVVSPKFHTMWKQLIIHSCLPVKKIGSCDSIFSLINSTYL